MSVGEGLRDAAVAAVSTDEIVQLVKDLVDIPSPTGNERPCAEFLQEYLDEAGIESALQELGDGRANIVGMIRGEGDGPTLMLNGHLDTTFYGDASDYAAHGGGLPNDRPGSFEISGGVYGLGAHNMKGGVGAIFTALRALKQAGAPLRGNVMASGVAGESEKAQVHGTLQSFEGPRYRAAGYGTTHLITHCEPIDYAIVAEPSDLYVANAQAGYIFVKVIVTGETTSLRSQGSLGSGGRVPTIDGALAVVQSLREWGPTYAEQHHFETGNGAIEPFVTVGAIEGGWPFFPSRTPAVCHVYVSMRLTPALEPKQALEELDARLRETIDLLPGVSIQLEVFASNAPSTITPADSLLPRLSADVMEQRLGFPTRPFPRGQANPSNDTNVFRRHGIPAVKCGPTTRTEPDAEERDRVHGRHVYRDDLLAATRFYVLMALELCGRTRSELAEMERVHGDGG